MTTLLEVLKKGTHYLESKGVEDARLVMELLLTHVLECDRLALYMQFDRPLEEGQLVPLRGLMQRKVAGEPLGHLLGATEFFGRSFRSDGRALLPRPETEELIERVLKVLPQDKKGPLQVLDMGTGSGVIGLTLALELGERAEVTLVDISSKALSLALENALKHKVKVKALQGDLFEAFSAVEELPHFDVIVANLPYIADDEEKNLSQEVRHDPALALYGGVRGDEVIERFLEQAPAYLSLGGFVALEIGWDQSGRVLEKMEKLGYLNAVVYSDLAGIPRFPVAFRPII